jgi:predicted ArsR family transcriptional regulator
MPIFESMLDVSKTRTQVLHLLRRGPLSVAALAEQLGITRNAVRFHLASLQAAGHIAQAGLSKQTKPGKRATLYMVTPAAEAALSAAYAPVLLACLQQLRASAPPEAVATFLRETGERLAPGDLPPARAPLWRRVKIAADVLASLGAVVTLSRKRGVYLLRGGGCPLGIVVRQEPGLCLAVEALLARVVGATVRQCCDHSSRPRCCFEVFAG